MRIIGGRLRGRTIEGPQHEGLRPTSDRVREAIFNILVHGIPDFEVADVEVLDLFAGSGALGLEALSRGASYCLFVDDSVAARALLRTNIEQLQLNGVTRIFRRDATDLGNAGSRDRFGLVFVDPPYGKGLGERALASAAQGGWLREGAIALLEDRKGALGQLPQGFQEVDRRAWGDTEVLFLRYQAASAS